MLQMLITRGASVLVKDKHGNFAKNIAEKKGLKEVVAILEEAEAKELEEEKRAAGGGKKGKAKAAAGATASGATAGASKAAAPSGAAPSAPATKPTQSAKALLVGNKAASSGTR